MFSFLSFLKKAGAGVSRKAEDPDRAIVVFENTSEVIRAESLLKAQGWMIRVMGPPPEIRSGCDLVIEIPLIEELHILRSLREGGVEPLQVVPVDSPLLRPVDLYQVKDFGRHLMVRAANMKLTFEKDSGKIVNTSGGGCPDIPVMHAELLDKHISDAPRPRDIGYTLCSLMLDRALEESQSLMKESKSS